MREALEVIDQMIKETAQAGAKMHLAAPQDFERLNASTGLGIRLQVLSDAKDRVRRAYTKQLEDAS